MKIGIDDTKMISKHSTRLRNWAFRNRSDIIGLLATVVLSMILAGWVMEIWRLSPHVPIVFGGDTFLAMNAAKNMAGGWYSHSSLAGWPFGQNLGDYPAAGDLGNLALLWLIANVFGHPGLAVNAYFLLGFPLVAAAAYLALRSFNVRISVAVVIGMLYTLLPYHFWRGESHLLLGTYWVAPLAIAFVVHQLGDRPWMALDNDVAHTGWRGIKKTLVSRPLLGLVGLGVLFGSGGFYYATFTALLIVLITGLAVIKYRSYTHLISGFIVVAGITGMVLLSLLPSVLLIASDGPNNSVANRQYIESEIYGLRFVNLVLPLPDHRFSTFGELRKRATGIGPQEGTETLGLIGALGFLGLIGVVLGSNLKRSEKQERANETEAMSLTRRLAVIAVSCTLMGVVAGFGSVLAVFGFTQLRAWNRISVFIAFAALGAVAIAIEQVLRKISSRTGHKPALALHAVVLLSVLAIGTLDQTSKGFVPQYKTNENRYGANLGFIKRIENIFGSDAALFQLPGVPFPENPPVGQMADYDHMETYLLSDNLKISYGGLKGRDGEWSTEVSRLPIATALRMIALANFDALYVDRFGYPGGTADLEARLTAALGNPVTGSDDQRKIIYDLRNFRKKIMAEVGTNRPLTMLKPPYLLYGSKFSFPEYGADTSWRWAGSGAELTVVNPTNQSKIVQLYLHVESNGPGTFEIIKGTKTISKMLTSSQPVEKRLEVIAAPGRTTYKLLSSAPDIERDERLIQFRLFNARVSYSELADTIND